MGGPAVVIHQLHCGAAAVLSALHLYLASRFGPGAPRDTRRVRLEVASLVAAGAHRSGRRHHAGTRSALSQARKRAPAAPLEGVARAPSIGRGSILRRAELPDL